MLVRHVEDAGVVQAFGCRHVVGTKIACDVLADYARYALAVDIQVTPYCRQCSMDT